MADFTTIYRRTTYSSIDPTNPANDQTGRTIVVTGSSEGIGYGIAQAYAQANAARVFFCSRSQAKVDQAISKIRSENPSLKTELIPRLLDASDIEQIASFWDQLRKENITVDVLVLNAAAMGTPLDVAELAKHFHFNTTARLYMLDHFQKQPTQANKRKILIDITSAAFHMYPFPMAAYSGSKAGFTTYLNHLAITVPSSELHVVSLQPGAVFTPAVQSSDQVPESWAVMWDHPSLSASMGVWLSTAAAEFLHGRYIWANYDVDEMVSRKEEISSDPSLLRVGVCGLNSVSTEDIQRRCREFPAPK